MGKQGGNTREPVPRCRASERWFILGQSQLPGSGAPGDRSLLTSLWCVRGGSIPQRSLEKWCYPPSLHPLSPVLPSALFPELPSVPPSPVLPSVPCPQCCSPSSSPPGPSPCPPSFSCSPRARHMTLPFSRGSAIPRGIPAYSGQDTHPGEMLTQGRKGLRPSLSPRKDGRAHGHAACEAG